MPVHDSSLYSGSVCTVLSHQYMPGCFIDLFSFMAVINLHI